MADRESGFTLVELLVVILIVGILAGIAVPVLLGQKRRAVEASMQSDLRTTAELMETYFHDRQSYPGSYADLVNVVRPDGALSPDNTIGIDVTTGAAGSYCLVVSNPAGRQALYYDSDNGGLLPAGGSCS